MRLSVGLCAWDKKICIALQHSSVCGHDYKTPHSGACCTSGGEEPQSNRHISPAVYISTLCIFVSHHFLQPITYHEFQDIDHQLYRHVGDRLHVFVWGYTVRQLHKEAVVGCGVGGAYSEGGGVHRIERAGWVGMRGGGMFSAVKIVDH